ncbi:MAG TPA: sigma-54 dependent transcriptional regulator, partial [Candidatus Binatia bacterium]
METRILIIDDDPFICRQLEDLYRAQNYIVDSANDANTALQRLSEHDYSLVLVDFKIPGTDGLNLTKEIRERWPDIDVIMITGYASIKGAVEAIKLGASDYITKPFQNEEVLVATDKVLEKRRLLDEIQYLRGQLADRYSFANMVSRNPRMHEIFAQLEALAQSDATVLLTGESGTGKELCARAIHFQGKRKNGKFVPINCAAFPDTLLESELFGYERGAFTGAVTSKPGLLETAEGGTIFLDEVGEMPLATQAKFLRVLEDRTVRRVGGLKQKPIDVRVIAATNRDLQKDIAAQRFRADLFYRLNGLSLHVPPLRERVDEICALASSFAANAAAVLN